jgi:hypothetical protein
MFIDALFSISSALFSVQINEYSTLKSNGPASNSLAYHPLELRGCHYVLKLNLMPPDEPTYFKEINLRKMY